MRRKLISVLLLIFITFISEKAYAKILNFPDEYLSIKDAINAAEYGDSVLIAPGAYYESQINLKSGVTILGADRDTTTIDGRGTAVFYDRTGGNTAIVENLTIRSGMGAAAMFISTPNSSPNIFNNIFADSAGGVVFSDTQFGIYASSILNNKFINNDVGIFIGSSSSANYSNISNNIFTGNDVGIHLYNSSNIEPLIQNNTIDDNGVGIKINNGPEPRISNNIITNNNGVGILLDGSVYTYIPEKTEEILNSIQYNDVFNNQGGNYVDARLRDQTGIHGNISENPLFVDAANSDYHLQPNSPAKDTGDPSILDPDGSRSDIGAYGGPNAEVPVLEEKISGNLRWPWTNKQYGYGIGFNEDFGLSVSLNVKLAGDAPIGQNGEDLKTIWKSGIENAWNDQYKIEENGKSYPITLNINWIDSGEDIVLNVHSGYGHPDSKNFFTDLGSAQDKQGRVAAHEVGHWLGLYDEYNPMNRPDDWNPADPNYLPPAWWSLYNEDGTMRTDFFELYNLAQVGYAIEMNSHGEIVMSKTNWDELSYSVDQLGLMGEGVYMRPRYYEALADWASEYTRRSFVVGQAPSYHILEGMPGFRDDVPFDNVIPEPSTYILFLSGLGFLIFKKRGGKHHSV